MIFKTDLFLKVSAFNGGNTPSAPRSTVIEPKIPPNVLRVLLAVEEVSHTLTLYYLAVQCPFCAFGFLDDW